MCLLVPYSKVLDVGRCTDGRDKINFFVKKNGRVKLDEMSRVRLRAGFSNIILRELSVHQSDTPK